jgi:hydroxymethylpyrimidine/phosphomethylpyrimidine kinase
MPPGSPGMDVAGGGGIRYDVFTFDKTGKRGVFATR